MPRELHPEGKNFRGVILTHGFSETKNQQPQIFVSIQNAESGKEITAFMSMSETMTSTGKRVIEYTIDKLRRCGFNGFKFGDLADGTLLKDNEILYEVLHEEYGGVVRDKVGWINDPNGGGIERSVTAEQNAARFDEFLRQNPPENPQSSSQSGPSGYAPAGERTPPPIDDATDVPF